MGTRLQRLGKFGIYWLVLIALLLIALYVSWCLTRQLPLIVPASPGVMNASVKEPPLTIAWPEYGQHAVGVTGYGVIAKTPNETPQPTASVAKVLLAVAVLEKNPLKEGDNGQLVQISAADEQRYQQYIAQDQSVVRVKAGESLTEYQALQALLIASANNVAYRLADWAFGSQQAYLDYANALAKRLGMTQTVIADASGFSPKTVSTPSDLVRLGIVAIEHPVIAQIANQYVADIPVEGQIRNYNRNINPAIVGKFIDGLKTGNTDEAGGTYLFTAPFEGRHIVGATMGTPDLGTALEQAPALAASVSRNLASVTAVAAGSTVGFYKTPWGKTVNAVADQDIKIVAIKGTTITPRIDIQPISTTAKQHEIIGSLDFGYKGQTFLAPVRLASNVPPPSPWWRLTHPFKH